MQGAASGAQGNTGERGSSAVLYRTGRCVIAQGSNQTPPRGTGCPRAPQVLLTQHRGQLRWVRPWHMPDDPVREI